MSDAGIGSWPTRRARMLAHKPALVQADRTMTYGALAEQSTRLAHGLRTRGVRRNDRVAYLGLNSVEFVLSMFATAKLGAVFVPLNTRLAPQELAAILTDAEPRLLLHSPEFDVPDLDIPSVPIDNASLAAVLASGRTPIDEPIGLDDLFMIQYTPGTSGRPKGVQLSHGNIAWNIYNLLTDVDVGTDEIALVTAPLFHTAALNQVLLPTLLKGGTALIEPRFVPHRALRLIAERRVTLLFGVTSMYPALAAAPGFADADLSSVRTALTGGAPLPEPVLQFWADHGVPLIQGYGLTETSPGATLLRGEDALRKLGWAGAGCSSATSGSCLSTAQLSRSANRARCRSAGRT